jgi:hypothetical protein
VVSSPGPAIPDAGRILSKYIPEDVGEGEMRLNVAVNYWFAPLFEKEFPCAECRKKINVEEYGDVLQRLHEWWISN